MPSNGARGPFTQNGGSLPSKHMDNAYSPASNYGVSSPEFDGSGFQPLESQLDFPAFPPPPSALLGDPKNGIGIMTGGIQTGRTRNSALLNVNDPVSLHLLVETAMGDSQDYEILSYEEVEAIKTEQRELRPRIEATAQKLALESKVRDAAQSLNRLNSNKQSSKRNRRSMTSRMSSGSVKGVNDSKTEDEIAASVKRCDELARDLWQLESREKQLQTSLLKHTAGILQMTHAGPIKKEARSLPDGASQNARPDSPQSLYNYDISRKNNSNQFEDVFDERSLYRSAENLDNLMLALKNGTHNTQPDGFDVRSGDDQTLKSVESRLEQLNDRLRDLIIRANPDRNENYSPAPIKLQDGESIVEQQLDFMDRALSDIGAEQAELQSRTRHSQSEVEGRLEESNHQLCSIINNLQSPDTEPFPAPPQISGRNMQEQISYLHEALYTLEQISTDQRSGSGRDAAQYEATLSGLWSIILAGEEEARQRKRQRRQNIRDNPDGLEREEDLSPDENEDPNEEFSLQAFSTKIQWLYSRASNLKDQQSILRRQIRQQRERNASSDNQDEDHVTSLRARIEDLEQEITSSRDDARIEASEMQANLQESAERIEQLTATLQQTTVDRQKLESTAQEATELLAAKEKELHELEGEVARLQTEVTIARAELDGAYGTRAQRAAEVASNPEIKREMEELSTKNATLVSEIATLRKAQDDLSRVKESERMLKEELKGMAQEYEALTRDSIQNEKDRDSLEAIIDALRDEKERLELELSDEKVRWLGARSPGSAPQGTEMTSVRMMREDFKKMMREKTTEALKALRAEQEERRKLEALVRQLRKGAEPAKSALSQSMSAS